MWAICEQFIRVSFASDATSHADPFLETTSMKMFNQEEISDFIQLNPPILQMGRPSTGGHKWLRVDCNNN